MPKAHAPAPFEQIDAAWIYRNPKPYLRAIHAYHPSVCPLADGSWLATFDLGQGPESLDYHTAAATSLDGLNWELRGPLLDHNALQMPHMHSIRTTALTDGRLVGVGAIYRRPSLDEGILNRATLGLCPMDLIWTESLDQGHTWTLPRPLRLPSDCQTWEVSHAPIELSGGRLGLPLAAWRNWEGSLPEGEQALLWISEDGGTTWPTFHRTFDGRSDGRIHWEQCVVSRPDGQLLAVAWAYDPKKQRSLPSVFTLSAADEISFAHPVPTGFLAETCEILALDENRILAVYRGIDPPGLWAEIGTILDKKWQRSKPICLWQGGSGIGRNGNASDALSALKVGSPAIKRLGRDTVLIAFWCTEDAVTGIRCVRLRVGE